MINKPYRNIKKDFSYPEAPEVSNKCSGTFFFTQFTILALVPKAEETENNNFANWQNNKKTSFMEM